MTASYREYLKHIYFCVRFIFAIFTRKKIKRKIFKFKLIMGVGIG